MNYFFIDAETDGLYGKFLSAAVLVTDVHGNEIEHFYGAVNVSESDISTLWVKENVLQHLSDAEKLYDTEYDLLEAVWTFWLKYRECSYAVADVMHPVESRLFTECVRHNEDERKFLSPFPMLDVSTLLIANGIDPLADRKKLSCLDIAMHNAINDVRIAATIWHKFRVT